MDHSRRRGQIKYRPEAYESYAELLYLAQKKNTYIIPSGMRGFCFIGNYF